MVWPKPPAQCSAVAEQKPVFRTRAWREGLPVIVGERIVLREVRRDDAQTLLPLLAADEVTRFISSPPSTIEDFDRFISRARRQRAAGSLVCFVVASKETDTPVGILQIRETEPNFATAEWGFAMGSAFWGSGLFEESAALALGFAFRTLGVHRLEARTSIRNGRGNRALQKLGAVAEGILRHSFFRNGEYSDQVLYAIVSDDWLAAQAPRGQGMIQPARQRRPPASAHA